MQWCLRVISHLLLVLTTALRKAEWELSYLEQKLACHKRNAGAWDLEFDTQAIRQAVTTMQNSSVKWPMAAIEQLLGAEKHAQSGGTFSSSVRTNTHTRFLFPHACILIEIFPVRSHDRLHRPDHRSGASRRVRPD